MTRSLSADLRGRVIAAIEEGVSTRQAARRFRIGISTAGNWYRRYRETGEMEARKQGQPSRSKLDAHEAFILDLIKDAPDITLAEIGERLAAQRGVRAAPSTIWLFLDRRGITFKKRRRTPPSSSRRAPAIWINTPRMSAVGDGDCGEAAGASAAGVVGPEADGLRSACAAFLLCLVICRSSGRPTLRQALRQFGRLSGVAAARDQFGRGRGVVATFGRLAGDEGAGAAVAQGVG
ncbi:MAG: transposase [Proteobacteria bacterium]|nr:transposase [Pseudomonadota bacterium]